MGNLGSFRFHQTPILQVGSNIISVACTTCCKSFKTSKTPFFPFLLPFGRKASMIDCDILEVKFPSSLCFKFSNKKLPAPTAQSNRSVQFLARCLQLWEWKHQTNWVDRSPQKNKTSSETIRLLQGCNSLRMLQVLWMKAYSLDGSIHPTIQPFGIDLDSISSHSVYIQKITYTAYTCGRYLQRSFLITSFQVLLRSGYALKSGGSTNWNILSCKEKAKSS